MVVVGNVHPLTTPLGFKIRRRGEDGPQVSKRHKVQGCTESKDNNVTPSYCKVQGYGRGKTLSWLLAYIIRERSATTECPLKGIGLQICK